MQHRNTAVMDLESMLRNHLAESGTPEALKRGEAPYLAVVHRLDQPVEGVMVFAKTRKAAADLSRQLQDGGASKEYLALVSHCPYSESGEWHMLRDFMLRDGRTNTSRIVPEGTPGAKEARLAFRIIKENVLAGGGAGTLLMIRLETGRHHQIRVQLSSAGMPIIGDRKYGSGDKAGENTEAQGLCLAAWRLTFRHPATGKQMAFEQKPVFCNLP